MKNLARRLSKLPRRAPESADPWEREGHFDTLCRDLEVETLECLPSGRPTVEHRVALAAIRHIYDLFLPRHPMARPKLGPVWGRFHQELRKPEPKPKRYLWLRFKREFRNAFLL